MKKVIGLLSLFVVCMSIYPRMNLHATTNETTYYEKVKDSYGVNCGKFKVNDILAYCANSKKDSPPKGTKIESIVLSNNNNLRKVLWYGSIGPGAVLKNDNNGWVQTAQAVSLACENGTLNSRYKAWYNEIIKKKAPPSGFKVYIAIPKESKLQQLAYYIYTPKGKCQLQKSSSNPDTSGNNNYSLKGAKYEVYTTKKCTKKVATFETDSNGKSKILELTPNTYYVKEVKAPNGYQLSSTIYSLVVNEDKTTVLNVKDTPITGKLQIAKSSTQANLTDNNSAYSLEKAEYTIYSDKSCKKKIKVLTTTKTGKSNTLALLAGTYYVKETKAPKGFVLEKTVYSVAIQKAKTTVLKVADTPITGKLQLLKTSDKESLTSNNTAYSLKAAEYTVYSDKSCTKKVGILKTGETGKSNTLSLVARTYYVKETKAPKGFTLSKTVHTVQVSQNKTTVLKVQDIAITGKLQLLKTSDKESLTSNNTAYSLKAAEYTVYSDKSCTKKVGTLKTGETGKSNTLSLVARTYYVKETKAPKGFVLSKTVYTVRVSQNKTTVLKVQDVAIKGKLQLVKSSNKKETTGNQYYSLGGAEYTVYSDKACTKKVGNLKTDSKGKSNTLALVERTYYVKETKAPKGFEKDSKVYKVVVKKEKTTVLKVTDIAIQGKVQILKRSDMPWITDHNENYSLSGAEYTVYKEKACVTPIGVLVTNNKGESQVLSLFAGTYYVKETKAPKGYALDKNIYQIAIQADNKTVVNLELSDMPQYAPIEILLKKIDADTNMLKGVVSLEGAQYTVKYYDILCENQATDPAILGGKEKMSWVLETDENGEIRLEKEFLVSGEAFFEDAKGNPIFPIGTITIEETKAPEGYLVNPQKIVQQITPKEEGVIITYNYPTVSETISKLKLRKLQEETQVPIPGVVFEHINPDGTMQKLMTDENGIIYCEGLQYGEHVIREIDVMAGYLVNENTIRFTVDTQNNMTLNSEEELGDSICFEMQKLGEAYITVYDQVSPYSLSIYKKDMRDQKLKGAEFGVYEEKECDTEVAKGVTDENGLLQVEGLKAGKKYYIKEIKAPWGYRLPTDEEGNDMVYEIWAESVPAKQEFAFYINGQVHSEPEISIVNESGNALPNTGGMTVVPILVFSSICILIGLKDKRKKKKGNMV